MAYNTDELYKDALSLIEKENLFFVEDVVAYLGIAKPTFYEHFKVDSNEMNDIKEKLNKNRSVTKVKLRKNWVESENASLQIGLYKLIGSEDERKKLNSSYIDQKTEHKGGIKITREIKK